MSSSYSLSSSRLEQQDREELLVTVRSLLAQSQALSSRIVAVNEIATAINRTLNLDEIFRVLGKQAKWLLDFEHLSLYLCFNDSCRLETLFGSPVDLSQCAIAEGSPLIRALRTGQSQIIHENSSAFLPNFASLSIVPLECETVPCTNQSYRSDRQIIGTINFATTRKKAYTQEDLRIAYLLGLQVSAAIRNASCFQGLNSLFDEINLLYAQLEAEKRKSEQLLLNILPEEVADELKQTGKVKAVHHDSVSVIFTDFQGFTQLAEQFSPQELVDELDYCFSYFDQIIEKYGLEKLKTIGDSYMCAAGIPTKRETHAIDAVLAAWEIQAFMQQRKEQKAKDNVPYWNIRIGIHSGSLMAGVIGQKKFTYDVWGDTVNIASRMESSGVSERINISQATFELVKDFFECEYRGKIIAKNKGELDMYLVACPKETKLLHLNNGRS